MSDPGNARLIIADAFTASGFVLFEQEDQPEYFGSWHAVYRRGSDYLRLVWDGKEDTLSLQELELRNAPPYVLDVYRDLLVQHTGGGSLLPEHLRRFIDIIRIR